MIKEINLATTTSLQFLEMIGDKLFQIEKAEKRNEVDSEGRPADLAKLTRIDNYE